jgi:hypothetical protein
VPFVAAICPFIKATRIGLEAAPVLVLRCMHVYLCGLIKSGKNSTVSASALDWLCAEDRLGLPEFRAAD